MHRSSWLVRVGLVALVGLGLTGCGSAAAPIAPSPVAQVVPTATVNPVVAYAREALGPMTQMQDGTARINVLLPHPLVMQHGMRDQAEAAIKAIHDGQAALSKITPPPSRVPVHRDLLAAMQYCDDAATQITKSLDARPSTTDIYIADAQRLFRICAAQLAAVTPRLGRE